MKSVINTKNAPAPIGPYNQAILSNNTLYVSGQIAINPQTDELITSSIEEETKQVMKNLQQILDAADFTLANVVKCTIFLKDMDQFANINKIYGEFFETDPPARETVEVSRLPKNVNVEISCIAVR
jgi:2-iminobutanoate/2-iminopropanoate deaminase